MSAAGSRGSTDPVGAVRPLRVVMISPSLPESVAEHAGGRLLADVVRELVPYAQVSVVAPDGPAVRRARPLPELHRVVRVAHPGARGGAALDAVERYVLTGRPAYWFRKALREHPEAVELLRSADVIDLQWQEQAALIPWLRRVNSRARITVTLHDVLSQRESRALAAVSGTGPRSLAVRARWAWARRRALTAEARLTGASTTRGVADAVAVLSEKDRALLPPGAAAVTVLTPPLAETYAHVSREPDPERTELLMVAYLARWANEEGLRWFVQRVLPLIREAVPHVQLRVAGTGIRPTVQALAREHGVELLGFVPDLAPLHRTANAAVVPLLQGAGVKFKVVDALSAGVPVVTTPVGAEGVGEPGWFAGVTEDPLEFATAVLAVLRDQDAAERRARRARELLGEHFGRAPFRAAVRELYGVEDARTWRAPEASVVIPAYNAAGVIERQLAALAGQEDAPPFEVVIANNRSTDRTAAVVARWSEHLPCGLRVVNAFGTQGPSHARNSGVRAARAPKILFCDSDDRVGVRWVRELTAALDQHDLVGTPSVLVHPDRTTEYMAAQRTVMGYLPYVLSNSMGVRRSVYRAVGGFDESYPLGHEEVDFCWRAQELGFTLGTTDATWVEYFQRDTPWRTVRQYRNYAQGAMLLWIRFQGHAPMPPVSFVGSVRGLVRQIALSRPLFLRRGNMTSARDLGWSWGTVRGHLRYRKVGKPPSPQLWQFD